MVVDEKQRTSAEGVFALGDVCSHHPAQARRQPRGPGGPAQPAAPGVHDHQRPPVRAARGLRRSGDRLLRTDRGPGRRSSRSTTGSAARTTRRPRTAGPWRTAATSSRCSSTSSTEQVIGAHLIGPDASSLIQPLVQAMSFGQRASDVARGQYWIHPALAEVVENALLAAAGETQLRRRTVRAARSARVSGFSASPTQRAYSRRWLGGRAAYAASAAGFSASAASSSGGSATSTSAWAAARPPRPARPRPRPRPAGRSAAADPCAGRGS